MAERTVILIDSDGNPVGVSGNPLIAVASGDVGGGVPDGGTTGQVLQKKTDADQDTEWGDGSGAATSWGSIVGTLADQTDLNTALNGKASKTESDLTFYVYEDATGTGDGSIKANGFTSLQDAIDVVSDIAGNVTIIVCKGSTNYLGQTTTIQKASVKSLTIRGEYYAYEACDANAVVGKVVDASAAFSDFEVGDRVVCTHYSGTVGSSSIDDYFYATITEVGEGYVQTSEGTKVPTTGWKYLINQTVFDGDNINKRQIDFCNTPFRFMGISCYNIDNLATYASETTGIIQECIFYSVKGSSVTNTYAALNFCAFINCNSISTYLGIVGSWYGATVSISDCIIDAASNTIIGVGQYVGATINLYYSGIFGCNKAIYGDTSSGLVYVKQTHIDSSCTYGVYGYNITLSNCTNNATTPVYNLTSGGSIEEWDGQALPSIGDATGEQVLRLKSDKSGLEFATVASSYTLPTASADTLGGVKIGSGITITDGVISASGGAGGYSTLVQRSLEGVVYETTLMYWVAPAACTIDSCSMSLSSNPSATGSYCKVQVMKNGTLETNSIFTADTPMQITESTSASNGIYTASGTLDSNQTTLATGDVIQFRVNQADTGSADLLVQMKVTFT